MVVVKKINRRAVKLTGNTDAEGEEEKGDQSPIPKISSKDKSKDGERDEEGSDRPTNSPDENVPAPLNANWEGLVNTIQTIGKKDSN